MVIGRGVQTFVQDYGSGVFRRIGIFRALLGSATEDSLVGSVDKEIMN